MKNLTNKSFIASDLLVSGEIDLKNYNYWVANKIIKHSAIGMLTDANVLDFGAGIGTLAKIIKSSVEINIDCLEIDEKQRKIMNDFGFNVFSNPSELIKTYNIIYTSNVLEHIEDDYDTLRKLHSRLFVGGEIIIYVPAFDILWSKMDSRVGHVRRYNRQDLNKMLLDLGFEINYSRYVDSMGYIFSLIFKILNTKGGDPSRLSLKIYDIFILPISKILDAISLGSFGKNIFVVAKKK